MGHYVIELDEKVIIEKIEQVLDTMVKREIANKYSLTGDVVAGAVKELVYSRKDEIIEMVVDRASREIARKGLVKLLERSGA